MPQRIFITGGSGYIGRRLIPELICRGHDVTALVRTGSEKKIAPKCRLVSGNALDGASYVDVVDGHDTFIHLVGVPHPGPNKARQFVDIDLKAAEEAIRAAKANRVQHFVYISVAHPAPVMNAYVAVRKRCEEMLQNSGLSATVVRPWYVLGPGHRWPLVFQPFYRAAQWFPPLRAGALRLGLIKLDEMVRTLVLVSECPASGFRIMEVPEIRSYSNLFTSDPEMKGKSLPAGNNSSIGSSRSA